MPSPQEHIEAHRQAGRSFVADGIQSFVREEGKGEAVVCMHGVPSSSYLYRKLLPALAERSYRGIAFDLPGMGLADKPLEYDYSWTGLGKWTSKATEALGLDKFHLVIHDIGGPVGMELVAAHPERILSLTILNTLVVGLAKFKKPWTMRPFEWKGIGEIYLKTLQPSIFAPLMYLQGVEDRAALPLDEGATYVHLLKHADGGKAFLKIMRSFEATQAKEDLYLQAIKKLNVPTQIIWGDKDPALTVKAYGLPTLKATGIERFYKLPGKHFLQEDQAPAIADLIAEMNA
ncbi:MAG: alpha/beta fold hydrolase [Bacteroidia bacterium]